MNRIFPFLLTAGILTGCGGAGGAVPARPTRYVVVGVDVSGSRNKDQFQESKQLLDDLIDQLTYGDHLAIVEMYQAGKAIPPQVIDSIPHQHGKDKPTASDATRLRDFRSRAHMAAAILFDPGRIGQISTTDVFGTLFRASDYLASARANKSMLVLLSDMINSTPALRMESLAGVPAETWITTRASDGLLPDLRNVCVAVVGADVSTPHGARVREFWQKYLQATGANLAADKYRNMMPSASQLWC